MLAAVTLHDVTLTSHMRIGPIIRDQLVRQTVVARDERLALIPDKEAGTVHDRVGEAPERVRVIGQEVGGDDDVLVGADRLMAQRTRGGS
jgi:hypothetical protein